MGVITSLATGLYPLPAILPQWGWLGAILDFLNSGLGNAAWTMIVFTLFIKLVTFPLDYYSRYKMKKNAVIMEDLKPQLEKIEKQCKGDKTLYHQRSQPLLKKEGYSVGGACLPTLITLVLFIVVFRGLNTYATYRNTDTYNKLVNVYQRVAVIEPGQDGHDANLYVSKEGKSEEEYQKELKEKLDPLLVAKYKELNPSWFWVKNPWRPDIAYSDNKIFKIVANVNPIPTYEEITNTEGKTNYGIGKITVEPSIGDNDDARTAYNLVMSPIAEDYGQGNGFYILAVVAVLVSFFSQKITQKVQGTQEMPGGGANAGTMKFMMILFPFMMGIFAFSSSTVFTLYIITNSTISLLSTIAINFFVGKRLERLKAQKEANIKYKRHKV